MTKAERRELVSRFVARLAQRHCPGLVGFRWLVVAHGWSYAIRRAEEQRRLLVAAKRSIIAEDICLNP